tara:strand:- start:1427 stop:2287 length:861 start_codon:yes stop_codon:yes gene_type:complete
MRTLFSFLFSSFLFSQSLSIISELDTTQGFIGDIFQWTVKVEGQDNQTIRFPELEVTNDTISIRNQTLIHENGKLIGIEFEIVAWDTGYFITPDYAIEILKTDGTRDYSISTNPIHYFVGSVLNLSDNTEYRPLKGPVSVKGIFPLKTVLLSIALLGMLGSMIWTWKQRQDIQYQKLDYTINESPEDRAKRRLRDLDMNGLSKDYYADLSHISREFIETKYYIRTMEMTTEEINQFRFLFPFKDEIFSEWAQFLSEADMVKYAREIPSLKKMSTDKKLISSLISQL